MKLKDQQGNHKIAIVGMSSILPGSHHQEDFWKNIVEGRNMIKDTPERNWRIEDYYDPSRQKEMTLYAKTGAFIDPILFDPVEFGVPPNLIAVTDTVQLLSLIAARDVLNDTLSYKAGLVDKERTSVILGVAAGTEGIESMSTKLHWPEVLNALRSNGVEESLAQKIVKDTQDSFGVWNENTFPGLLSNVVAGRIANRFDFGGTNSTMDAACASSLTAIKNAVQELQIGNTDMVISGGADALNSIFMYMCFNQTGALSKTGDCRAFDEKGDGTILGEGLAFFTLKRLEDAIDQGDRIYSVIAGVGSSSDGKSKSIYAPDSKGQAKAIKRAHEIAGTKPEDIELIEAHGTGTVAGDFGEFNGLRMAFGDQEKQQYCALGSVKSQIGHTKSTAGAASLHKVVLSLYNKVIPPTIKVEQPSEKLDIKNSPFYLNTATKPWVTDKEIRRAGVSSFGFGGTNFHCIVEEYISDKNKPFYTSGKELLLLSAEDLEGLKEKIKALSSQLESATPALLAKSTQLAFDANAAHRISFLIESSATFNQLKDKVFTLLGNAKDHWEIPGQVVYSCKTVVKKVAFVCAGQGSQYLNMGRELLSQFTTHCATSLATQLDENRLCDVVYPVSTFNDEDTSQQKKLLNKTEWAQPAIGAITLSHFSLLNTLSLKPEAIVGHSYGELPALYCAGVIKEADDLINISRKRGELMNKASSTEGAMTAVFVNGEKASSLLKSAKSELEIANYNSPKQTVVTGTLSAIIEFEAFLEQEQVEFKRLPVSTAFHSKFIAKASEEFEAYLNGFSFGKSKIPVYSNIDADEYPQNKKGVAQKLATQLKQPVHFVDQVEKLYAEQYQVFLEVGPGNNLTNLIKQILGEDKALCISLDGNKKQNSKDAFWWTLGQLSAAGISLTFGALWEPFHVQIKEERTPSKAAVKISGANYAKPYPENIKIHEPVSKKTEPMPVPIEHKSNGKPVDFSKNGHQTKEHIVEKNMNKEMDNTKQHQPSLPTSTTQNQPSVNMNTFTQIQQSMHQSQLEFMRLMMENQNHFLSVSMGLLTNQPAQVAPVSMAIPQASYIPPALPASSHIQPASQAISTINNGVEKKVEVNGNGKLVDTRVTQQLSQSTQQVAVKETRPSVSPKPASAQPQQHTLEDMKTALVNIVAEKTGYPAEVLDLEAELESGLGIDSIKRVEILSALQKDFPALKKADNTLLAKMNTLAEILDYAQKNDFVNAGGGQQAAAVSSASNEAAPEESISLKEMETALVNIVAEKTGYPAEVLDLEAELESGLGIDSIKRVEILSTLQKDFPALKKMDTAILAKLATLSEIIAYAGHSLNAESGDISTKKKSSTPSTMML